MLFYTPAHSGVRNQLYIKDHRAQWLDNTLVVAGGLSDGMSTTNVSTESCKINVETDQFDCVRIEPNLRDNRKAVSFAVLVDFCV